MTRKLFSLLPVCLAIIALAAPVMASDEGEAKAKKVKPKKTHGTVTAVTADSISIQLKAKKAKKGEEAPPPRW